MLMQVIPISAAADTYLQQAILSYTQPYNPYKRLLQKLLEVLPIKSDYANVKAAM